MRIFFSCFACSVFLFLVACNGTEGNKDPKDQNLADSTAIAESKPIDSVNVGKFKFEEGEFDFGNIKEGEIVTHVFKFTNVGKTDLVINNARGSCGCTIPSYPKDPIGVGESGEIEVQFNSKGKSGANQKFVSIVANTYPEVSSISIKANVQPQDETLGPMAK